MDEIIKAGLPGFYLDTRGAYGIVIGTVYVCCFINSSDGKFDVTADTIDGNGDFALNIEWESYDSAKDAIQSLRRMVKNRMPKRG